MAGDAWKKPSAKAYLQVLGAATVDTTPSLLLFTDSQRYIFNCGEGTQRLFNEHKLKLSKINNFFLTQICWEYIGGLPGMAMTLRDNGRSRLSLHGPENVDEFIETTRFFLHQEKLHFDCVGFNGSEGEKFEDENVTIWPVILSGGNDEKGTHCNQVSQHEDEECNVRENVDDVSHIRKKRKTSPASGIALSYICRLADLPGKFLPKKAIQLGVPKGPLFGELQKGQIVTLKNGVQVKPEEVMESKQAGPVFMIIDCPSCEHMPNLISSKKFSAFQTAQGEVVVTLIVHLTPVEVYQTSAYQNWIESFGEGVQHLLFSKTGCTGPVFQAQHRIQCRLHTVDPQIFPLLHSFKGSGDENKTLAKNVTPAENFQMFHLRPIKQQGFDNSDLPAKLNSIEIMKDSRQLLSNTLGRLDFMSDCECSSSVCSKASNKTIKKTDALQTNSGFSDICLKDGKIECMETSLGETECESTVKDCSVNSKVAKANDLSRSSSDDHVYCREQNMTTSCQTTSKTLSTENSVLNAVDHQTHIEPSCSDFDLEVVFIGTGASLPSKYRNVSATLVNISVTKWNYEGKEKIVPNLEQQGVIPAGIPLPIFGGLAGNGKSILLDCGEGTYGQLYCHYGNQVDDVIQRLSCVFISHIHADHHLGLVRILIKRQQLLREREESEEPLLVIGPKRIGLWLHEYDSLCQSIHYSFIDSSFMTSRDHKWKDKFELLLNAKEIVTVPVEHCVQAYGLVWRHSSGCTIVYSGDTRPCMNLVDAGVGATILIHEATFEDELRAEALDKMHSTTTEAINSGLQMNAKLIMLNHFSQRYPKIPVFSTQFTDCTGIAFDHMRISPRDFAKIPRLLEPLKVLFAEEMEELSSKTR